MVIEVGAKVTWRHGKSKPDKKGARVRNAVANCIVVELTEDGRARIRLPDNFGNQEVKVSVADLERDAQQPLLEA
jgi:3'-phosphoadenosine 5'-phosphosulfate sulfotransferase